MILIIDAYNMIKRRGIGDDAQGIKRFLGMLSLYAFDKKHDIYVVFDGYRDDIFFNKTNIHIVFAGIYNKSADDEILNLIRSLKDKQICAVTDDRALGRTISRQEVSVIKNDIMWEALGRWHGQKQANRKIALVQKGGSIEKNPWSDSTPGLDTLMIKGSEKVLIKDLPVGQATVFSSREKIESGNKKKHIDEKIIKKL